MNSLEVFLIVNRDFEYIIYTFHIWFLQHATSLETSLKEADLIFLFYFLLDLDFVNDIFWLVHSLLCFFCLVSTYLEVQHIQKLKVNIMVTCFSILKLRFVNEKLKKRGNVLKCNYLWLLSFKDTCAIFNF